MKKRGGGQVVSFHLFAPVTGGRGDDYWGKYDTVCAVSVSGWGCVRCE